jgi:hypothetical protein
VFAFLSAGSVEYDAAEASIDIDMFIAALEEAKENGATAVVGLSGNYRGAKYVRLGLASVDEDED